MMKRPNFSIALLVGGIFVGASFTAGRGDEPGAKAADGATLEDFAEIPASEFTKVMDGSASPNERLAVALGSPDGKKPDWEEITQEGAGSTDEKFYLLEECRNYVIDVKADRVTGILDGTHFGTRSINNHESGHFVWSPDSSWLVETRSWKWHTETCTVHRLDDGGRLVAKLDFSKAAGEIVDTWLREHWPKLTEEQRSRYAVTISVDSISNDGLLVVGISAEIPKDEDAEYVSVLVTAKVEEVEDGGLTLRDSKVIGRR